MREGFENTNKRIKRFGALRHTNRHLHFHVLGELSFVGVGRASASASKVLLSEKVS